MITEYGNLTERFVGLSTDTKQTTNVRNGSTFVEIDTGKAYIFNEASKAWVELESGGPVVISLN